MAGARHLLLRHIKLRHRPTEVPTVTEAPIVTVTRTIMEVRITLGPRLPMSGNRIQPLSSTPPQTLGLVALPHQPTPVTALAAATGAPAMIAVSNVSILPQNHQNPVDA